MALGVPRSSNEHAPDEPIQLGAVEFDVLVAQIAELLIDCEEDRTLRAVLVGMLPGG